VEEEDLFTPKYRRKVIYNKYKESIVQILKDLCKWKGVEIIEGKVMVDHIHLLVSIPPKLSVSSFMGYLKGKSALMIFDSIRIIPCLTSLYLRLPLLPES
jgi:putative transposase